MVARSRVHEELFNSSFTKIEFDGDLKLLTTQPPKCPKRVHFSQRKDEVFEIPHIDDLSDEEIDAVWMHDEDFKAIRKECRNIIMAFEKKSINVLIGVELRGLEHHMPSQRKITDATRDILYGTVEKLQCFQDESNVDVSDMMAEMCQKVSLRAVKMAHRMALGDEVEAQA